MKPLQVKSFTNRGQQARKGGEERGRGRGKRAESDPRQGKARQGDEGKGYEKERARRERAQRHEENKDVDGKMRDGLQSVGQSRACPEGRDDAWSAAIQETVDRHWRTGSCVSAAVCLHGPTSLRSIAIHRSFRPRPGPGPGQAPRVTPMVKTSFGLGWKPLATLGHTDP